MPYRAATPCTMCGQPAISRGRCARHKRPTTNNRGYDQQHKQQRESWAQLVAAGKVICYRCEQPIKPGQAWDLGHHDTNRALYTGPEHEHCNRSAARTH